jgi:hypothetical protein
MTPVKREIVAGLLFALGVIVAGAFVPVRTTGRVSPHRELKVATNGGWAPQSYLDGKGGITPGGVISVFALPRSRFLIHRSDGCASRHR